MNKHYDYLIVGAGLFGAVFAHEATSRGYSCLVIDKRNHIGGNAYTKNKEGIMVHMYGPHIFHTSNKRVWDYVNQFAEFNGFVNQPLAKRRINGFEYAIYNLPFNMNTLLKIYPESHAYGPQAMKDYLQNRINFYLGEHPEFAKMDNLKTHAIKMVGPEIYNLLIKDYTEKQWGKKCEELPSWIIKRLPVRFSYNNNYFNDRYQGVPVEGYTKMVQCMLENCDVMLDTEFSGINDPKMSWADKIVYTGPIDQFFNYQLGELEWRSLNFNTIRYKTSNFQGNAVINNVSEGSETRTIEHKFFACPTEDEINAVPYTYVTWEFPQKYRRGETDPYYPINNGKNDELYVQYKELANKVPNVIFGGRLAEYKYYDMDKVIERALSYWE